MTVDAGSSLTGEEPDTSPTPTPTPKKTKKNKKILRLACCKCGPIKWGIMFVGSLQCLAE